MSFDQMGPSGTLAKGRRATWRWYAEPVLSGTSQRWWTRLQEELRALALQESTSSVSEEEARQTIYQRSKAVQIYVKRRAEGTCEGCGNDAPFVTPQGRPYLEAHHVRRVSDGGPDHPRWVIALCPNCHRRIHHGKDGDEYNETLIHRLGGIESS
jgi:5-methylcytosine-specific restriction protein A